MTLRAYMFSSCGVSNLLYGTIILQLNSGITSVIFQYLSPELFLLSLCKTKLQPTAKLSKAPPASGYRHRKRLFVYQGLSCSRDAARSSTLLVCFISKLLN